MSWKLLSHVVPIQVLNEGEWGTFYVREGQEGAGENQRFFCDLTIHSAFGNVAYFWSHMGSPARTFLSECSRDYLMDKLFGDRSTIFSYDKTLKNLKTRIIEQRKQGDLGHGQARQCWQALNNIGHVDSAEQFWNEMLDDIEFDDDKSTFMDTFGGPADMPWATEINPQAKGLWEKLWPDFLAALQSLHDNRDLPT